MTDPDLLPWLREAIEVRLWAARALAVYGDGTGAWSATRNDDSDYTIHFAEYAGTPGANPVADIWREDAADFIAANDPRDVIARCEAELAILDEHRLVLTDCDRDMFVAHPQRWVVNENPDAEAIERARGIWDPECRTCRIRYPCRTVRFLAAGYRHHPGWDSRWEVKYA